jgi:hypothetical protein
VDYRPKETEHITRPNNNDSFSQSSYLLAYIYILSKLSVPFQGSVEPEKRKGEK